MTLIWAGELMVGRLTPYLGLAFVEFLTIAGLMRFLVQFPVAGTSGRRWRSTSHSWLPASGSGY